MGPLVQQPEGEILPLTKSGRKHLERETQQWEETTGILARFLTPDSEKA